MEQKSETKQAKQTRKRRLKRIRKPADPNVIPRKKQILDSDLGKEKIGRAGLEYMAALLNPFRKESSLKDIAPRYPDGSAGTVGLVLTGSTTVNSASLQSFLIQLVPPDSTNGYVCLIYAGNDAGDDTKSPTTCYTHKPSETTIVTAIMANKRYRVVAGGLKINFEGSLTNEAGNCRAGWSPVNLGTGSGTYGTYETVNTFLDGENHFVKNGITVRHKPSKSGHDFVSMRSQYYDSFSSVGPMPFVRVTQMTASASASIRIEWVLYVEVEVSNAKIPLPIKPSTSEVAVTTIESFCNNEDAIVEGNSFKAIWRTMQRTGKKVFKFVENNAGLIKTAATIAGML